MVEDSDFLLSSPPLAEAELNRRLFEAEQRYIMDRRAEMKRRAQATPTSRRGDRTKAPLTGLALSGGGIRSASVCLGALQALHRQAGIEGVDYLSTVSGGGFIGCSLIAGLDRGNGVFPFANEQDFRDTDAVRHIRDFSRYLIPNGLTDLFVSLAIFLRGLLANVMLLAPLMFFAAWLTLKCHPDVIALRTPRFLWWDAWTILPAWVPGGERPLWSSPGFYVTQNLLLITLAMILLWAFLKSFWTSSLWRSFKEMPTWVMIFEPIWRAVRRFFHWVAALVHMNVEGDDNDYKNPGDLSDELRGLFPFFIQILFVFTIVSALFEFQPFILERMPGVIATLGASKAEPGSTGGPWFDLVSLTYNWLAEKTPMLAPYGAALAFMSKFLINFEKFADRYSNAWLRVLLKVIPSAGWWFVGLMIPSLLWWAYLQLCEYGLTGKPAESPHLGPLADWLAAPPELAAATILSFLPKWAGVLSSPMAGVLAFASPSPAARAYLALSLLFSLLALFINPNATSFFRLYRDRLNKAFVFDPNPANRDSRNDLRGVNLKLHKINTDVCPYPIINAALNLEGSQFANKRGRNADFFMFSKAYCGSVATGYVSSSLLWREERDLDLATAMAISGAAISANMGSATIKPLVATLALLNVRLGYWLRNPRKISPKSRSALVATQLLDGARRSFLLFAEVFSLIDENSSNIYLTDGGNLENLGLYELLRRKCKIIIAVDAEADPGMDFPSLITLARYARTDLGVIIDLPWEGIRTTALQTDAAFEKATAGDPDPVEKKKGPHCAVCTITYSANPEEDGLLFYFKSSLTGDEIDVVFDYKRRHAKFPHETTIDQFFGEHQLEAYRALGYHMLSDIFDPSLSEKITMKSGDDSPTEFIVRKRQKDHSIEETKIAVLNELRAALIGEPFEVHVR